MKCVPILGKVQVQPTQSRGLGITEVPGVQLPDYFRARPQPSLR
jgi:hypothetical protein